MTPPALTWLHLLPADCAFKCESGPEWLRASLNGRSVRDGRRASVHWNDRDASPDIANSDAFVAVNGPASLPRQLAETGLSHVTRLAVLPSLDQPRWFIPLSSSAASAAAFNLYSPTRLSARLKRSAAQLAARVRLPIWYRDQILIAQREAPPLERRMRNLFPNERVSIALSAGAPEGARNRKASAAVIANDGRVLAFVKLAGSELSESLLRNEARILRALADRNATRGTVPRLLFSEPVDGTYTTAQTPLEGRPAPAEFSGGHRQFLDTLRATAQPVIESELIRGLSSRIQAMRSTEPQLVRAFESALEAIEREPVAISIVHGDFAPWNLRLQHGHIAAFDWEYGSLSGPSGLDEIHHRLQVGYLLEHWTVDRAAHEFRSAHRGILMFYLVDMLARLLSESYDRSNAMLGWLEQLLAAVCVTSAREVSVA
ncbi:MAG TPA: phosphotransferase [Tepidisphaeraceae bacterium]|nr:phosphotransferase [Tepidisphaeraceae bacterium]